MNLILIENDQSIDKVISHPEYVQGRDVILCFCYLSYWYLKNQSDKHICVFNDDLFFKEDYDCMHSETERFASTWFYQDGADVTLFNNVSFGDLIKPAIGRTYMSHILVKYGEAIRKSVEKWGKINCIYYDFTNKSNYFNYLQNDGGRFFNKKRLVECVAKQLNIKTSEIITDKVLPTPYLHEKVCIDFNGKLQENKKDLRGTICYFAKLIHNAISRFLSLFNGTFNAGKVYFFNYYNINSFVQHHAKDLVIPNFGLKDHLKTLFSGLTFADIDDEKYELDKPENSYLKFIRDRLLDEGVVRSDCDFVFNGIDYSSIYEPALKNFVECLIPFYLAHMVKVRNFLKRMRVAKLVVNDITDEKNGVIIAACRQSNVKVYFVDHGIKAWRSAYPLPFVAPDVYFEASTRPFYEMPLLPEPLGTPIMDQHAERPRKKVSRIKKILFLTFADSHYARLDRLAYRGKYYAEIFSVFKGLSEMGMELYYRTHSENQAYHDYMFDLFDVDRTTFKLKHGGRFCDVIREMDLMVCNFTTCFFEAQASGIPTIFLEPHVIMDALQMPLSGEHMKDVIRVSTGKDLMNIVKRNKDNPAELNKFLDAFIETNGVPYIGNLDGKASERISDYIFNDKVRNLSE
ncbi:MAG: hypothetical protein A2Y03_05040 [Omnitrophica WOR_2 bacterium GWF2_38_59]|nr:MAG: hypothetical protein A2Y03_05040 [Omnitrophica WOR_2 bacterium GWF2_38_59]OGX48251.1 MAG: hypothetical protein A2243_10250 [Omnitrophica WOR_2 bacterium RIFOXYA2_FULL_38_17]OGX54044.1 MAG: hypothetical protein A2267_05865 [Omnitrophica WOR_2 bacterium RIFOXYA12_FULL_38_10]OGX59584.1 MAG: hypothetical protein A2447_12050 [Omnitrophica WOR_2 bacterium RIFOXYC2_FULL_38_12]OGX59976.1 MAG: hypothetical protein A2306_04585 [Omnitrophica WOR_2 bacterium RIFOXYB2_FULL_38_16]